MATLTAAQDAYDRHDLHVGVIHSDVADVILKLEAEIATARNALADMTQQLLSNRSVIDNLHAVIEELTDQVKRQRGYLDLIRRYCGEHVAGLPIEARTKALIVTIPVIVDHALDDMISGGEEAYAIIVANVTKEKQQA